MPYGMDFADVNVPYRRIFIDAPRRIRLTKSTCALCARALYTTDALYCSAKCQRFADVHTGRQYFAFLIFQAREHYHA